MVTGQRARLAIALTALLFALPSSAQAFDTGPHADMTRDALTAEGFNAASANIAAVNNWFTDYYSNPDENPFSGHASAWIGITRLFNALGRVTPRGFRRESWPNSFVEGARRMHFDAEKRSEAMPDLSTTAGVEREWDRLENISRRVLDIAETRNDPLVVLAAIGMITHSLQDFYTHSNWVEDPNPEFGRGGPGVARLGYGSHPTYFDVPPEVRRDLHVYTGVEGIPRDHGHWRSNGNTSLHEGLNKDSAGRPKFQEAYVTAYFATRQWVRAMRIWLDNEPLWNRAMSMTHTGALAHDMEGATEISKFLGHLDGGGEPCVPFRGDGLTCGPSTGKAGSITSAFIALGDFHDRGPTPYRRAFNQIIGQGQFYPADVPEYPDLPSTRTIQQFTRFVKLEVINYRGIDLGDPVGDADIYANARIAGQAYTSTVINGEDSFAFPLPYGPFSWTRSIPTPNQQSTPVTSMTVRIETGDRRFAGTDDDVHLRINGAQRFSLEKRAYNDFERGDDDTYSVPIGDATKRGLTIGDIDRVAIEKSRDGVGGGWFLKGVTLNVNGQVFVSDRRINRWLENNRRTWSPATFTRDDRTDDIVGAWLQLKDDDFGPQDTGDVNVFDRHTSFPIAYQPGTFQQQRIQGGSRHRGRLSMQNGDLARLTYRIFSFGTIPPPPPPPLPPEPPPPPPVSGQAPDLVISNLTGTHFTVRNEGNADAGSFRVTIRSSPTGDTHFEFTGLARGQEATREYSRPCEELRRAVADSNNQVAERDESNNTREFSNSIC
jgi:hypothetical protein